MSSTLVIASTFVAAAILDVTPIVAIAVRLGTDGQNAGIVGAVPTAS